MKHFDAIIIGTGQAGPSLAARFAGAGKTVAIIERHRCGGPRVNMGCIPARTVCIGQKNMTKSEAREKDLARSHG